MDTQLPFQAFAAAPFLSGLVDGMDPALPDELYAPSAAPALLNLRVGRGLWETRYGMSFYKAIGGAAPVHFLGNHTTKAGARWRLAAMNGTLYHYQEGAGGGFTAVTGGAGLATNVLRSAPLGDYLYFTDRGVSSKLRRYDPAAGVVEVTQPAAPTGSVRAIARTFKTLEAWSGAAPYGWTRSNSAKLDLVDGSADEESPLGGACVKLSLATNGKGATVYENVADEELKSARVAFWIQQKGEAKYRLAFELGLNAEGDFSFAIEPPERAEWYPFYVDIGDVGAFSFKRFRAIKSPGSVVSLFLSKLVLPGRLNGKYKWRVTHYNPTTGAESAPSADSNSGSYLDLSKQGVNYKPESQAAFQKSAMLVWDSDSGTDPSTTKIRIYRNGGVSSLTTDSAGQAVWVRVAEIFDLQTTLTSSPLAGASSFTLASVSNLVQGDWLCLDKNAANEEFVEVLSVVGSTVTINGTLAYAHTTTTSTAQLVYLDNNADQALNSAQRIDEERHGPPTGIRFLGQAQDGRLWVFGWDNRPLGVAMSNLATPDRQRDWEVFPENVDPITRNSATQGFRFDLGGNTAGDEVMWGGFHHNVATIITRRALYQVFAHGQPDWGNSAVSRRMAIGCISGDTVAEQDGILYWCAPGGSGPRVMAWDGRGAPRDLSFQRVNVTLEAAPTGDTYYSQWHARCWTGRDGAYYSLFMVPNGAVTPTVRLDYSIVRDVWERVVYYQDNNADGVGDTAIAFPVMAVRDGPGDNGALYGASSAGTIYRFDDPARDTDEVTAAGTTKIKVQARTKRYSFGGPVSRLVEIFYRLAGVASSDTWTLTITTGGSEYGEISASYVQDVAGSGDLEVNELANHDQQGRWIQFELNGDVAKRPMLRDLSWRALALRDRRVLAE